MTAAAKSPETPPVDSNRPASAGDVLSLEALLVARAYLYTMFHKLAGGEPTAELVDLLLGDTMHDSLDEYADDVEALASYREFLDALRETDRDELVEAMRDEFSRCYIGPASLPAVPLASPNITKDPSAVQKRTLEVRRCYREHGLEPKRLQRVPDDHLSLICAFCAHLARRALAAFDAGDGPALALALRDQKGVVDEHLNSWMPDYAKALRRSRTAIAYPQTAEALAMFARADGSLLGEAAFWLEANPGALELTVESEGDTPLKPVREALHRLEAVRLFALDENELVPAHG